MTLIEHYANLPIARYRLTIIYKGEKCIYLQFNYWEYFESPKKEKISKTYAYCCVNPQTSCPPTHLCPLKNNKCMTPLWEWVIYQEIFILEVK